MDEILISFIIPAYNCEKYIEECVKSILKVKVRFECIIINDGSTDKTYEICRKLKEKSEKIKIFSIKNSGVSYARNFGIEKSRGKYITFVDSDDYIIEESFSFLENADLYSLNISMKLEKRFNKIFFEDKGIVRNFIKYPVYMNSVCNKFFRRDVIEKNNIRFNSKYYASEDQLFVIDFIDKIDDIKYINKEYYIYRVTNNSATTKKRNFDIIMNNYMARVESINICKKSDKLINNKHLIKYLRIEAAIQFLIFKETYNPIKFRELTQKGDIWIYSWRIDYWFLTISARLKLDIISNLYIKIKKIMKKR